MEHNKVVREEFSRQASRFGEKGLTLSSQDILAWIVDFLPLDKELRVLDIAAGTGHLSRAIAPYVREVIAIDITPAMLVQAREESARGNQGNLSFVEGSAEQLPCKGDCFDLVVSRLAIHHFENPSNQLREMVRVCKTNHRVGIVDLLAPEDGRVGESYNALERMRDPSHTVALSKTQMETLLKDAGIVVERIETRDIKVDFLRWVQMTGTKSETIASIQEELMKDINDGSKTGMRPFLESGSLKFLQVWSIIIGKTISSKECT
jgi:ubiquinone/menaquinone biosynthesis C-methylase UbiE